VLDASEQSMNERNEQLDEYNCNAQLHAVVVVVRSEVVVAASRQPRSMHAARFATSSLSH